jgi:photosystem II stability/assembly factor-like uncharacterized protein
MKYLLLFIFFLIIIQSITTAQPQWWGEQNSGVTVQLKCVSACDNYNIWICGYSGTVLRTTNGGVNWQNVSGNGIPNTVSLVNIWGIDLYNALVAGYISNSDTWVWKTTNGGANWIQIFTETGGFIDGIAFKDGFPAQGIMMGDPVGGRWSLWKTTNYGTNWDSSGMYVPQAGSEAGWNNSLCYAGPRIWFGTNNTRIYYSYNDGASWTWYSTSPEVNSYVILFNPGSYNPSGILGGATLMKSDDTGHTWTTLSSIGTGNFGGFASLPLPVNSYPYLEQLYYVRTSDNKIYHSGQGGMSWFAEYTAPSGNYAHMTRSRNGQHIWAVRSLGGITRCTCVVSGINKISENIPDAYSLKQNFPNPFNPQTSIDFDIPKRTIVKINIYDIAGRYVTTLIDNEYQAGSYRVFWDASSVSSGVYFYSMQTTEYTMTKRMVLLK